jgi:hypothetical protein
MSATAGTRERLSSVSLSGHAHSEDELGRERLVPSDLQNVEAGPGSFAWGSGGDRGSRHGSFPQRFLGILAATG